MTKHSLFHGYVKSPMSITKLIAITVMTVSALIATTVWASDSDDHERAKKALQSGQILPLRTVLESLERKQPGKVLEVELEQKDALWIYKVKLLRADGQLIKLMLDAKTAELIERKNRDVPERRKIESSR